MKHSILLKWTTVLVAIFALSMGVSAKKVVCIDGGGDGFLNSHEGWERQNATSTTVIQVGGSLTDCLAQLADGDTLVIVAHGINNGEFFRWGGTDYSGFGNGAGKMPLPAGFGNLDNIKVDFCSCWSKKDPDGTGSNKSLADKLKDALGNNPTIGGFTDIASARTCYEVTGIPGSGVTQTDIDAVVDSLNKNTDYAERPPHNRNPEPANSDRARCQEIADAKVGAGKVTITMKYYQPKNVVETSIPDEGEATNDGGYFIGDCGCDPFGDICGVVEVMQAETYYTPPVTTDFLTILPQGLYSSPDEWIFIHPDPAMGDLIRINDVRIHNLNPVFPASDVPDVFFVESFFDVFFDIELGEESFEEVSGIGSIGAEVVLKPYSEPGGTQYWDVNILYIDMNANTPMGPVTLIPSANGLPSVGSLVAEEEDGTGNWNVDSFFDVNFDIDFNGQVGSGCGSNQLYLRCAPLQITTGCTEQSAGNYDPCAVFDDGSCMGSTTGCTYANALNYNPMATIEDGSCILAGCMDATAINYNPFATNDDGTCDFTEPCMGDLNNDGLRNSSDLLDFLSVYGEPCEIIID